MSSNPFFLPVEEYTRDYDVMENYIKTAAKSIALDTGAEYSACIDFVRELADVKDAKSPAMKALRRKPRMDRKKASVDFIEYYKWIEKEGHSVTPNMVTYANPKVEKSFLSGYVDNNLTARKAVKKAGFAAEMEGNKEYAEFCNLLQSNFKIRNNSISGATVSPHNPLYCGSSHTSLTSACRAVTSYANAINEKLLASNRHYYSPEVTLANIAYIARAADLTLIAQAMDQFGIEPPTKEYVFNQIMVCAKEYWHCDKTEATIKRMLSNMTGYELAAFSFVGDLNALLETNDKPMRKMFDRLTCLPERPAPDADAIIKNADDDIIMSSSIMSSDFLAGHTLEALKEQDPVMYGRHAARIKNIQDTFAEYSTFIRAFFATTIMPTGIHSVTTAVRRAVVASDTDSSIFTGQRQAKWYTGSEDITVKSTGAAAVAIYFTSQSIAHYLAVLCGQLGVEESELFRLTMKSEYWFEVMVVTTRTKHYMSLVAAKEGNVYAKPKMDMKGVALKSSKLPTFIRNTAETYMETLMHNVRDNKELTPKKVMSIPAYMEHTIIEDVQTGNPWPYRSSRINTKEGYKKPMSSDYIYYELWNEVFASKYGRIDELPCSCKKLSVSLKKKVDIEEWAAKLPTDIGRKLLAFCNRIGKESFTQLLVPADLMPNGKIPEEFLHAVDIRSLVQNLCEPFYITMECYGLTYVNGNRTRLVSDDMAKEEAEANMLFPLELKNIGH